MPLRKPMMFALAAALPKSKTRSLLPAVPREPHLRHEREAAVGRDHERATRVKQIQLDALVTDA